MKENRRQRCLLFLTSQSITLFGSTLTQMAIIWYITAHTGSGAWIGAFTTASYLPQFLISLAGGAWADRWNRKWMIMGADGMIAVLTGAMALAMPRIPGKEMVYAALLFLSALRSLGAGIQVPASGAAMAELAPEEERMRFNGMHALMQSAAQLAAPGAAGIFLSVGSIRGALWADVVTAAMGMGLLWTLRFPASRRAKRGALTGEIKKDSLAGDIKEGMKYVRFHALVGRLLAVYGFFIFFTVPGGFLDQLLVSRRFGDSYGYMAAAEAVGFLGMVLGGGMISLFGGFGSRGNHAAGRTAFGRLQKNLSLGLTGFGILTGALGCAADFPLYLLCMFAYGVCMTAVQTAVTTLLQEKTDPEVCGRVFGLMTAAYSACLPLGMAFFGPLADRVPLPVIMGGSGGALVLLGWRTAGILREEEV